MQRPLKTAVATLVCGFLPAVFVLIRLQGRIAEDGYGTDLGIAYLGAARDILDGDSPYPASTDASVVEGTAYVYTPVLAFAVLPLTVAPADLVVDIGMVAVVGLVLAILWLAGVRDWRCYGISLLWPPTANEIDTLNVSVAMAVVLALAWRLRESEGGTGVLVGLAIALKAFVAPMLVWLVARGGRRPLLIAATAAILLVLAGWGAIGFAGLGGYPTLIRALTERQGSDSYSVFAAASAIGIPSVAAGVVAYALAAVLLAVAWHAGRAGNDRRAFAAALLASLAATPILWQHYLLLLLLALAVARPRFSLVWLLPIAFWTAPENGNGTVFTTLLVPAVAAIVGVAALLAARDPEEVAERRTRFRVQRFETPR